VARVLRCGSRTVQVTVLHDFYMALPAEHYVTRGQLFLGVVYYVSMNSICTIRGQQQPHTQVQATVGPQQPIEVNKMSL
jgi:hypothetical protein